VQTMLTVLTQTSTLCLAFCAGSEALYMESLGMWLPLREEPPYPVRVAFQKCLGDSTDSVLVRHIEAYVLVRHIEAYVTANPTASHGPMIRVVMRALFDLCRGEISKIRPPTSQG
jgi:hypothetical protein